METVLFALAIEQELYLRSIQMPGVLSNSVFVLIEMDNAIHSIDSSASGRRSEDPLFSLEATGGKACAEYEEFLRRKGNTVVFF